MTKYAGIFNALAKPFTDVRTFSKGGKQLSYVTARQIMNRLDDVLGPENWWDDYVASENSVVCRLTIRLPDGTTLTKCDAGGHAGMADAGDDDKSAYSDSFKRAASKHLVGRHLYGDGYPRFAAESPEPTKADPAPQAQPKPPNPAPRKPDARTYWRMVLDATNRRNETRGESISPDDTHWMLVVLAANEGLCPLAYPDMVEGPLAAMDEIHATDPTWVLRPLMRFVAGKLNPRKVDNLFRFEREDWPLDAARVTWDQFVQAETSDQGRGSKAEADHFVAERTKLPATAWKDAATRRPMLDALRDYVAAHPCSLLPEGA